MSNPTALIDELAGLAEGAANSAAALRRVGRTSSHAETEQLRKLVAQLSAIETELHIFAEVQELVAASDKTATELEAAGRPTTFQIPGADDDLTHDAAVDAALYGGDDAPLRAWIERADREYAYIA